MTIKLTDMQLATLSAAAQREDRGLTPPTSMRGAQLAKMGEKLIAAGLVREVKAKPPAMVWRRDAESGTVFALKLTAAGMKASAAEGERVIEASATNAAEPAPSLTPPMARTVTAMHEARLSAAPTLRAHREPRATSKIAGIIAMLTRSGGATLAEMIAATDWLPHTTRAALTGLRKRGYAITLDRSDRERGSVYRGSVDRADPKPPAEPSDEQAAAAEAA